MEMDHNFMDRLESVMTIFDRPIKTTSAFCCHSHNAQVSSTGFTGHHTTGKSIYITVSGQDAFDLLALATTISLPLASVRVDHTTKA
jgi:hypothetical protein